MSRKRGGPIGVFNGNWKNRWRRELEDEQDRRVFIIEHNKNKFGEALDVLKFHDRDWETWYDDDANIPPYISWLDSDEVNELCRRMIERADNVKETSRRQSKHEGGEERAKRPDSPL